MPQPETEKRVDVATDAPGTVGVNLDRIRPAVFANSIAPKLGVEMPRVASGTYASATIATSLSAAAKDQGAAQDATAATFTVTSVTPKRISARLSIQIEDIAAVGQANFESILRENLALVLSDELDDQALNGDGQAPNLAGIFQRLTDPSAPGAVADFDAYARCARGRGRRPLGQHAQGGFNRRRPGYVPTCKQDVSDRDKLQRRNERGCLRHGEYGRILDQ